MCTLERIALAAARPTRPASAERPGPASSRLSSDSSLLVGRALAPSAGSATTACRKNHNYFVLYLTVALVTFGLTVNLLSMSEVYDDLEEEPSIIVDDNAVSREHSHLSSSRASELSVIMSGSRRPSRSVSPSGGGDASDGEGDDDESGEGDGEFEEDLVYESVGDLDPLELAQMRLQLTVEQGEFAGEPENTLDRQFRAMEMWKQSEQNTRVRVGDAQVTVDPMLPAQHGLLVQDQDTGGPSPAPPPPGFESMLPSTFQTVISGKGTQFGSADSLRSLGSAPAKHEEILADSVPDQEGNSDTQEGLPRPSAPRGYSKFSVRIAAQNARNLES